MELETSVVSFYYNKAKKNLICILGFCIATCIIFFATFKGLENISFENIIISIEFATLLGLGIKLLFLMTNIFKNWILGIIAAIVCIFLFFSFAIPFVEKYKIPDSVQEGVVLLIGLLYLFGNVIAFVINGRKYRRLVKSCI